MGIRNQGEASAAAGEVGPGSVPCPLPCSAPSAPEGRVGGHTGSPGPRGGEGVRGPGVEGAAGDSGWRGIPDGGREGDLGVREDGAEKMGTQSHGGGAPERVARAPGARRSPRASPPRHQRHHQPRRVRPRVSLLPAAAAPRQQ